MTACEELTGVGAQLAADENTANPWAWATGRWTVKLDHDGLPWRAARLPWFPGAVRSPRSGPLARRCPFQLLALGLLFQEWPTQATLDGHEEGQAAFDRYVLGLRGAWPPRNRHEERQGQRSRA